MVTSSALSLNIRLDRKTIPTDREQLRQAAALEEQRDRSATQARARRSLDLIVPPASGPTPTSRGRLEHSGHGSD